jgi:hypothetical protein
MPNWLDRQRSEFLRFQRVTLAGKLFLAARNIPLRRYTV